MNFRSHTIRIVSTAIGAIVAAYVAIYGAWQWIDRLFLNAAGIDKVLHFFAGATIWLLSYYAVSRLKPHLNSNGRLASAFFATVAIVVADELLQTLSSRRTIEVFDPLSGLAGAVVVFAIVARPTWRARVAWAAVPLSIVGWAAYNTYERNHFFFEGMLLEREARYEDAYARYLLALEAAPDNAEIYNSLAWICLEFLQRDYDKALGWALQGIALAPNNSDLLDTLGWAYYKNGEVGPALELVSRAAELDPDHPVIREHLNVLREETGAGEPRR